MGFDGRSLMAWFNASSLRISGGICKAALPMVLFGLEDGIREEVVELEGSADDWSLREPTNLLLGTLCFGVESSGVCVSVLCSDIT
ncbi:hypothetical protein WICPIJ_001567 [Wickerhamomyces pijperi]|uniref:Uncharacterized protein n=1 Tax=Wickerhamomyces pijperi TaxID=599730 RepID=A0A9P8QBD4_WICPI|nr:hypothetical protein WICPIJ_001567 [Wickerhamomyces pijperi]